MFFGLGCWKSDPALTTLDGIGHLGEERTVGRVECLYEDDWGSIIDRPEAGYTEIRWFDTTSDLDREAFNAFLKTYASTLEARPGRSALVDSTSFRMDRRHMDNAWRDANIVPRYNAAGLRKFAFILPAGGPLIGQAPSKEGPAQFPTGYFGTRRDALAWLKMKP
jgi:hypothetical protein